MNILNVIYQVGNIKKDEKVIILLINAEYSNDIRRWTEYNKRSFSTKENKHIN